MERIIEAKEINEEGLWCGDRSAIDKAVMSSGR